MEIQLVLCLVTEGVPPLQLAASLPETKRWVTDAAGLWCHQERYLPARCGIWNIEMGMKTAAGLQRIKFPDCCEQLMAYECTKLVSSKADKHQGPASLTVLDLGYPRCRINIQVWEILGKFIKLGSGKITRQAFFPNYTVMNMLWGSASNSFQHCL